MEKIGGRVCIFMKKEGRAMFRFMSNFSKFISFIVSNNVRVGSNFVYGKSMGSLLQHLDHLRENCFIGVVGM